MLKKYNHEIHNRRSIRLRGYDYSNNGIYFITISAWQRECLFGIISNGKIKLNYYGNIVKNEWQKSKTIRKEILLDVFTVMPNHLHGIVIINKHEQGDCNARANGRSPLRMKGKSISSFVAGFKSAATKEINIKRKSPRFPVWQRNYYERIIRNDNELIHIREYVHHNARLWKSDKNNPANLINKLE